MAESNTARRWSFVHVSDIHVGTPRSYRFQPAWNENWKTARAQIIREKADLLLVGGDLTRDGSTHVVELEQIKHDLDHIPMPVHVIPGNHEVGNKFRPDDPVSIQGEYVDLYRSVFGPSHWSFVHKNARFSGFDAFLLGSGLPEEAELRIWLEQQKYLPGSAFHVWMIHPALFADSPDDPDFDPVNERVPWYFSLDREHRFYLLDRFRETGATHVISGHIHCRRVVDWQGIEVHFAPSTAFPQWGNRWSDGDATPGFLRFDVTEDSITSRFIPLDRVSDVPGYGPGGNPPFEGRDYSVAWERPHLMETDIGQAEADS